MKKRLTISSIVFLVILITPSFFMGDWKSAAILPSYTPIYIFSEMTGFGGFSDTRLLPVYTAITITFAVALSFIFHRGYFWALFAGILLVVLATSPVFLFSKVSV